MFPILLWATIAVALIAVAYAWDMTRDVFHPAMYLGPMLAFLYGWMPWKLWESDSLGGFFSTDQLEFVQILNFAGVSLLLACSLLTAHRTRRSSGPPAALSLRPSEVLLLGGILTGGLGLMAWLTLIVNAGGIGNAFGKPYSGGWDDSGYVRDGVLLMYPGMLAFFAAALRSPSWKLPYLGVAVLAFPCLLQALLTSRRGPTFVTVVTLAMGWFLFRNRRPPLVLTALAGLSLGWLVLFLVSNRGSIYIGSDMNFNTEVTEFVEKADTGNEFIYGSGTIISTYHNERHFWGKRYLAQILVRPIPSAIWPNKYEDFGVPELLFNGGTGDDFKTVLGWDGAWGSAPGLVADLWVEFRWGNLIAMGLIGLLYGWTWQKAITRGNGWIAQYAILAALSIYLVMQTIEAALFRSVLLSVPVWIVWGCVRRAQQRKLQPAGNPWQAAYVVQQKER